MKKVKNRLRFIDFHLKALNFLNALVIPKIRTEIIDFCCFHGIIQYFIGSEEIFFTIREKTYKLGFPFTDIFEDEQSISLATRKNSEILSV